MRRRGDGLTLERIYKAGELGYLDEHMSQD